MKRLYEKDIYEYAMGVLISIMDTGYTPVPMISRIVATFLILCSAYLKAFKIILTTALNFCLLFL
ncbi:MAG: hypothetical protein N2Z40_03890 [Caldimicrobium sp.]|nr:hypothetical protein [Caldimicrobium sp.]